MFSTVCTRMKQASSSPSPDPSQTVEENELVASASFHSFFPKFTHQVSSLLLFWDCMSEGSGERSGVLKNRKISNGEDAYPP